MKTPNSPRVLACTGNGGTSWVIGVDEGRECVVVDGHHAARAVVSVVEAAGLSVIASLGTSRVPAPTAEEEAYVHLLSDLGLGDSDPEFDRGLVAGPVEGWDGALLVRVGARTVELGDPGQRPLVYVPGGAVPDPMALTVSSVVVRFGALSAVGSAHPAAPAGTLAWRVRELLFVARRGEVETPGYRVIATDTAPPPSASWGGHAVRLVEPSDLDLVSDVQIVDVEPVDSDLDQIAGARRVGASWRTADLELDPWRRVLVVSADGIACGAHADVLAKAGFQVLRLRGGTERWSADGMPLERAPHFDLSDLSEDDLTTPPS